MSEIVEAEIMEDFPARKSQAVAVVEDTHTYRPTLVLAPEEASLLVEQVKAMQRSVLVQGTDYMTIPGTGKPSLLKPGAERLMQVFGLGHRMEQLDIQYVDGKPVGVTYRCTVTKMMMDGRELTVSSCDGHASSEEPKWRKAPWNTIIKMAQKRALVGATLTATATSGLFTQDMEDAEQPPQRSSNGGGRTSHRDEPEEDPNLISKPQVAKIQMLFKDLGITDREDRLALSSIALARDVASTKDLTKAEASKIIDYLASRVAESTAGQDLATLRGKREPEEERHP